MVNKLGKKETLIEYHSNNKKSYHFGIDSDGYCFEYTYDLNSKQLTYRNSDGECTGFHEQKQETNKAPTHYDNGKEYDLIDVINDYNVNFCRGNVIKYVVRAGKKKDELQDLLKAKDYLEREIKRVRINNNNK